MKTRDSQQPGRARKLYRSLSKVDRFSGQVAGFRLAGRESYSSLLGCLCSVAIIVVMALYASVKFD